MRQIDADALMIYVLNLKDKKIGCNDIARFPTAYDTNKVIEQLKNASCRMKDVYGHEEHLIFTDHAIEIVKKGGVE